MTVPGLLLWMSYPTHMEGYGNAFFSKQDTLIIGKMQAILPQELAVK
jgi:hypothetical protein